MSTVLQLMTERDPRAQIAQIQVIIRAGSLLDPPALSGLANLTGRALLRGTRSRSYSALTAAVERMGGSLGVRSDQDLTVLRGSVLNRNLDAFLKLMWEVLTEPAFDEKEVATLKNTIEGELKANLQEAQELASRAALKASYKGTAAERVPDGTVAGIAAATSKDLREFFAKNFLKQSMIVGVVSALEDADISARIEARMSCVPVGTAMSSAMPQPTLGGKKAVIVDREGMSTTPIFVAIPGVGDADPELPALEVANFIFGEDFTGRLMQELRAEKGWTYGVSSSFRQLVTSKAVPGIFSIYLSPSAEFASLAIPRTLAMLKDFVRGGITEQEFVKTREALGNSYAFKVATAEQRLGLRMRTWLTGRPFETTEQYARRLANLTLSEVNQAVSRRLRPEHWLVTAVGEPDALKPVLAALPGVQVVETVAPETLGL
jgi:zinc protease